MSVLRNVETLLRFVHPEDRLGYVEELPQEVQDAFWAELDAEAAGRCAARNRDVDPDDPNPDYDWDLYPLVGEDYRRVRFAKHSSGRRRTYWIGYSATEGEVDAEAFRSISPADYVEVLTGTPVDGPSIIVCPLPDHNDSWPSFQVYEHGRGFCCWGCQAKGDIFNFAAALWGLDTKRDFRELVKRLASAFRVAA